MTSSAKHSPNAAPGRALWPWYGALVLLAAAFWACYIFFVHTKLGQWIDEAALLGGEAFLAADKTRGPALAFLDYMPAASALLAGGFILFALVRRRDFLRPMVAGALLLGAAGSTQLLKHVVLDRPDLNISGASMNSFPSGHTTFAAAAMAAIFIVTPEAQRPLLALLGWGYAAIAGASTLVLGWHRPSDVIAAYLVVAWWSVLAGLFLRHAHGSSAASETAGHGTRPAPERFLRALATLGAPAAAGALALALLMPHPAIGTVGNVQLLLFLAVGLALVLGTAVVTGLFVHVLFARYGAPIRRRLVRGIK
ncbi:phosphatase PAP2 family protein [Paeniglutamicibacter sp.]|uniref:phosphatase PAP2 family protein n=1 Tax=Paeniglutamicibacter sp. TaxID=1934391 RepID=UPI00398A2D8F